MKTLHLLVLMSLLVLASCGQKRTKDETHDVEAITQLSKARAEAFIEGNAREIAKAFTTDGCLMAPDEKARIGREAVATYYQSIFDAYETDLDSYYEEVVVDGDLAFGRGIAKVTLISKAEGDTTYSTAKYLNVLSRQPDGSWLTTHDIWNEVAEN